MPWLEKVLEDSNSEANSVNHDGGNNNASSRSKVQQQQQQQQQQEQEQNIESAMKPKYNLLFVHVPRCGGTSLMKAHNLPQKAEAAARSGWNRFGMRTFFHRYALLEKDNFPLWTEGNAVSLMMFTLGGVLMKIETLDYQLLAICMMSCSVVLFTCLTFIFVAPTIARIPFIRRAYLIFVHYICCRFMENLTYVTGTNLHGYLNHLTCAKMIQYGYVSKLELQSCSSLAIVRNPYARLVSIYMYNRFGKYESFQHFVKSWHKSVIKHYRDRREMEDWYTPCHAIPQFEYTHLQVDNESSSSDGSENSSYHEGDFYHTHDLVPLVHSIVKQEDLKLLKQVAEKRLPSSEAIGTSIHQLPDIVANALLNMPHDNQRRTTQPWYEYYDQETIDLCYEMYGRDFEVFGYNPILEQRPDLQAPKLFRQQQNGGGKAHIDIDIDIETANVNLNRTAGTSPCSTCTTPASSGSSSEGDCVAGYQNESGFYSPPAHRSQT
jgi:hypothetical protein